MLSSRFHYAALDTVHRPPIIDHRQLLAKQRLTSKSCEIKYLAGISQLAQNQQLRRDNKCNGIKSMR
jgi:hypothetical protein